MSEFAKGGYVGGDSSDVILFSNDCIFKWKVYDKEEFTRLLDRLNKGVVE